MTEDPNFWAQWLKPSAGFDTLHWSLLLAVASLVGYLLQRHLNMPKVLGYAAVGTLAGFLGFSATAWPLQGPALFLLELGVSIVLFECGGRITLRWFRHNPMVLVQSLAEAALTYGAVYFTLRWLDVPATTATPLALIAMAASPVVLARVINDTRAVGPVTDRAMVLATLSTLYALTLGSAKAEIFARPAASLWQDITPVLVVLGVSVAVAALLCLAMRLALQLDEPHQRKHLHLHAGPDRGGHRDRAAHLGGSAPLAAAAGRHAAQAAAPAPLGVAAPAGHRASPADHADVRAGLHRGRAGHWSGAGGRRRVAPGRGAPAGQGRGRGPGQHRAPAPAGARRCGWLVR